MSHPGLLAGFGSVSTTLGLLLATFVSVLAIFCVLSIFQPIPCKNINYLTKKWISGPHFLLSIVSHPGLLAGFGSVSTTLGLLLATFVSLLAIFYVLSIFQPIPCKNINYLTKKWISGPHFLLSIVCHTGLLAGFGSVSTTLGLLLATFVSLLAIFYVLSIFQPKPYRNFNYLTKKWISATHFLLRIVCHTGLLAGFDSVSTTSGLLLANSIILLSTYHHLSILRRNFTEKRYLDRTKYLLSKILLFLRHPNPIIPT